MIVLNGTRGNFSVSCDNAGCPRVHYGRRHKDPSDLPSYTHANVRRQARRRGWATVINKKGIDLCPPCKQAAITQAAT